jgi:hypothetical protein
LGDDSAICDGGFGSGGIGVWGAWGELAGVAWGEWGWDFGEQKFAREVGGDE